MHILPAPYTPLVEHAHRGFFSPLTTETNLLEPNIYLLLIGAVFAVVTFFFWRFVLRSLLMSPGMPVRVRPLDE